MNKEIKSIASVPADLLKRVADLSQVENPGAQDIADFLDDTIPIWDKLKPEERVKIVSSFKKMAKRLMAKSHLPQK